MDRQGTKGLTKPMLSKKKGKFISKHVILL